jgi:ABC-type polysaccharide/polyol phosphate export permease
MVESTTVFLRAKSWISSTQFPLAIHAFRALFGWLITFAHQLVIIVLAFVIAGYLPSATALLAIIGLLIVNVMMFGLALLFGTLGARFRDLTHVLASMTTLFFIVTPIFWFKALLPPGHPILAFNPMYYFMEILRAPLLGEVPPLEIWLVAGSIAIGTLGLGLITFYRSFKSIMLWL